MQGVLTGMFNRLYAVSSILLIFLSIWAEALENTYPDLFGQYSAQFIWMEYSILAIFTAEYLIRAIFTYRTSSYLFSFDGIIDGLSVIPSLLAIAIGQPHSLIWLRTLRLVRLTRILKVKTYGSWLGGISGRVIPYVALALGLKSIVLIAEQESWWELSKEFNIVIGVIGFSLAVLLGSKLSTVNSRIYAIEDAVCRLVGSMRDMWSVVHVQKPLKNWSREFEAFIKLPRTEKLLRAHSIRDLTDQLEESMEDSGVGGPNSAGFHRDAAFLIHRATAKTPAAYDRFLKYVISSYCITLIIAIPGLLGILATILTVYVLGGVYFLIDDMDDPLSYEKESFIDARLDSLEYWNESRQR